MIKFILINKGDDEKDNNKNHISIFDFLRNEGGRKRRFNNKLRR